MDDPVVIYSGRNPVGMARRATVGQADEEGEQEFTLNDVSMVERDFGMEGPFDVRIRDQLFGPCTIANYRRLRPGFTYDRVVFQGRFKRQVLVDKPPEKPEKEQESR